MNPKEFGPIAGPYAYAEEPIAVNECGMAELSEEDKQWQLQRKADQSDLINLILHYKNPADDEVKLRQIRLVME